MDRLNEPGSQYHFAETNIHSIVVKVYAIQQTCLRALE